MSHPALEVHWRHVLLDFGTTSSHPPGSRRVAHQLSKDGRRRGLDAFPSPSRSERPWRSTVRVADGSGESWIPSDDVHRPTYDRSGRTFRLAFWTVKVYQWHPAPLPGARPPTHQRRIWKTGRRLTRPFRLEGADHQQLYAEATAVYYPVGAGGDGPHLLLDAFDDVTQEFLAHEFVTAEPDDSGQLTRDANLGALATAALDGTVTLRANDPILVAPGSLHYEFNAWTSLFGSSATFDAARGLDIPVDRGTSLAALAVYESRLVRHRPIIPPAGWGWTIGNLAGGPAVVVDDWWGSGVQPFGGGPDDYMPVPGVSHYLALAEIPLEIGRLRLQVDQLEQAVAALERGAGVERG